MAEIVKRRVQKIPKYVCAYYPVDKTTCVVTKEKVIQPSALEKFLQNPALPATENEGIWMKARFKNPGSKHEEEYDGMIIAIKGEMFVKYFNTLDSFLVYCFILISFGECRYNSSSDNGLEV